jgi:hypothetical protein
MMAYFPNGSDGDYYLEKYCNKCIHGIQSLPCPVMSLHLEWNYDAVGDKADLTKKQALDTLWPCDGVHNGDCAMFSELPEVK